MITPAPVLAPASVRDARPESVLRSTCLLRWTFQKGGKSVSCQLDRNHPASSYDVCVVPHWDVASTVVERTHAPMDAFRRHAEIVTRLRAGGWSLTGRLR
jgi:hypothetical protein